jgi:hypothetical protein
MQNAECRMQNADTTARARTGERRNGFNSVNAMDAVSGF